MSASLTAIARRLTFVRETDGPNAGYWVSYIQRFTGNQEGDSWCASFVSLCVNVAYKGKIPVRRTASCQEMLDDARAKRLVVPSPAVDDLFFYVNSANHAHHVGIVTGVSPLTGIAGNTSPDGRSSNGTGVYEHEITPASCVFVRLPQ